MIWMSRFRLIPVPGKYSDDVEDGADALVGDAVDGATSGLLGIGDDGDLGADGDSIIAEADRLSGAIEELAFTESREGHPEIGRGASFAKSSGLMLASPSTREADLVTITASKGRRDPSDVGRGVGGGRRSGYRNLRRRVGRWASRGGPARWRWARGQGGVFLSMNDGDGQGGGKGEEDGGGEVAFMVMVLLLR